MGKKSRTKGKAGELELCGLLRDLLGDKVPVKRNLNQARDGGTGGDVAGVPGWAIECKRAAIYCSGWWDQAEAQATNGEIPALAYRLDRRQWMVELRGRDVIPEMAHDDFRVTMPLEAFATVVRERA